MKSGYEGCYSRRSEFQTCPHCGFVMSRENWDEAAHTLILEPTVPRTGCVAVLSECSSCFEDSWAHRMFDCFGQDSKWSEEWILAVSNYQEQQKPKDKND